MSRPTSRVLQLLELLQSSGTRTAAELADRLEVDERTVRRYVAHLLDLNIPVEAVRGRYGGYRLARGYRLPPLMLSDEEAVAVLLGLVSARTAAMPGVSEVAAETATAKIRRALPDSLAARVRSFLDSAVFAASPSPPSAPDAEILLTVADAVSNHRPLEIRYRSGANALSRRQIHPNDLIAYRERWYLIALDTDAGEERTFRLDRIVSARTLVGSFLPQDRDDDVAARLVQRFASADYEHHVILRVQASEADIRTYLPPSVAELTEIVSASGDPWYQADIRAERLDWIPGVIAALGCPVLIDGPAALRELTSRVAERLAMASSA